MKLPVRHHPPSDQGSLERLNTALADDAGATTVRNLSTELRMLVTTISDLIRRIDFQAAGQQQPERRPGRPGGVPARWA